MHKPILFSLFMVLIGTQVKAQHTEGFELPTPTAKVSGSLYTKFTYLDLRVDTANMGFVQTGGFNRKAIVVPIGSLKAQLTAVFNTMIDAPKQQGELLLLLRQCRFAEVTSSLNEKGYFSFRASLYAVEGGWYRQVGAIDTLYIKSAMDVTKGLLKDGKDIMNGFIAGNLLNEARGPVLSYNDVVKADSIEKSKLPVYNAATYSDGLYLTYKSFKNQKPDSQFELTGNNLNDGTVKAPNSNGELKKIKPQKIYALVYKGQPYISSSNRYYAMKREQGDLLFTGIGKIAPTATEIIVAGTLLGAIGGAAISGGEEAIFDMKIDHLSGEFIRLREIKGTQSSVGSN